MTQLGHFEVDVLRRMLRTPAKPREKPLASSEPRRRARPISENRIKEGKE